jgi:hypothetical protein
MTASQFSYQLGDIVEIIDDPWKELTKADGPHLGKHHAKGKLATVVGFGRDPEKTITALRIAIENCACQRRNMFDNCMLIDLPYVKIHPSSPRFIVKSRWSKIGKEIS